MPTLSLIGPWFIPPLVRNVVKGHIHNLSTKESKEGFFYERNLHREVYHPCDLYILNIYQLNFGFSASSKKIPASGGLGNKDKALLVFHILKGHFHLHTTEIHPTRIEIKTQNHPINREANKDRNKISLKNIINTAPKKLIWPKIKTKLFSVFPKTFLLSRRNIGSPIC